jgi:hypothetical protein
MCEGCDGSGIRFPAHPSCDLSKVIKDTEKVVERCDACELFYDDLAAAEALSSSARIVRCADGGEHAVINVSYEK